jgi:hypothetical protein
MAKLTTRTRKVVPNSSFVFPDKRSYPIPDASHARNALARVAQHGTPYQKKKVSAAVHRRFPKIGKDT